VHGAVFGDGSVDGPLTYEELPPYAGAPRDRDQPEAGVVKSKERVEGGSRQDAVREDGVVEIEEQPLERAGSLGVEARERTHRCPQRASTRAMTHLR
jgi:hypothetical protein